MFKIPLALLLPGTLLIQCGRGGHQTSSTTKNPQQTSMQSQMEKCGFSNFKPMKAQVNYGSPVLSMPQPAYAVTAHGRQGKVVVLLLVNVRSGTVEQTCVLEGDEALASAAKSAGLQVRFEPYSGYIQNKYTYAEEIVKYNFVAQ